MKAKYVYDNKRLRPATTQRYDDVIDLFNEHLKQHEIKFSLPAVKEWLSHIINPNTYNVSLHATKAWLKAKYAKKSAADRLRVRELYESIHMKKPRKAIDENSFLTPEQVYTLASNAPVRISCFIHALFQTGTRISALLNIKLTDCVVKDKYILIHTTGKCDIEGTVSMTIELFNKIRNTFHGQSYLFETFEGQQYSREYVSREIHAVGTSLKINTNCHILRHSKAMYLKSMGYTPDEISRALLHVNILTTLEYYFHNTLSAEQQLGGLKQTGV